MFQLICIAISIKELSMVIIVLLNIKLNNNLDELIKNTLLKRGQVYKMITTCKFKNILRFYFGIIQ